MTISKVDPLSALKIGSTISVVVGIMIIVTIVVLWFVLNNMKVSNQIDDLLQTFSQPSLLGLGEYPEFERWMGLAVIIAIVDAMLPIAVTAVGALLYNLIASLIGGQRITITDKQRSGPRSCTRFRELRRRQSRRRRSYGPNGLRFEAPHTSLDPDLEAGETLG